MTVEHIYKMAFVQAAILVMIWLMEFASIPHQIRPLLLMLGVTFGIMKLIAANNAQIDGSSAILLANQSLHYAEVMIKQDYA